MARHGVFDLHCINRSTGLWHVFHCSADVWRIHADKLMITGRGGGFSGTTTDRAPAALPACRLRSGGYVFSVQWRHGFGAWLYFIMTYGQVRLFARSEKHQTGSLSPFDMVRHISANSTMRTDVQGEIFGFI